MLRENTPPPRSQTALQRRVAMGLDDTEPLTRGEELELDLDELIVDEEDVSADDE